MLAAVLLWSALLWQEDDLLRFDMYPENWAAAITVFSGEKVDRRDIRAAYCNGFHVSEVFCQWQQRVGGKWRQLIGKAELSADGPARITEMRLEAATGS